MKKFIKYIVTILIFTAQNLFAQSVTAEKGMDLDVYATWFAVGFFVITFIMVGVFLRSASNEPFLSESVELPSKDLMIKHLTPASGNLRNFLPSLVPELQSIRFLFASALIIYSVILLLLIIQK